MTKEINHISNEKKERSLSRCLVYCPPEISSTTKTDCMKLVPLKKMRPDRSVSSNLQGEGDLSVSS